MLFRGLVVIVMCLACVGLSGWLSVKFGSPIVLCLLVLS